MKSEIQERVQVVGRQGEVSQGLLGQVKGLSFIFNEMGKSLKGFKQI